MKARLIRIAAASVVGLVIAAGIAWWQVDNASSTVQSSVPIGGPFTLTDQDGKTVTDAEYRGKYLLIYFGYTYCPDVCPTELGTMARAMDLLGVQADKVQPMFISVDPERDTVAHLKDYVGLFHPNLVGLTGTPEQVKAAAKAYRVYYAKAPQEGGKPEDYLMDHSSFLYLVGPDGRFLGVYPAGTTADRVAQDLGTRIAG
ncbi:SCO family protein [Azospirillum brasilense]|uniref:SCO family protein n=1 Tax=Azospirillum brasilense TaxID=192 RepID=A0A0P0EXC0_AZOBR|nr:MULTISPECIES: SCO family protein [Azospirillum]ALJ34721.1 electron transporter SenC [Azospirillum brasilense]MDW7554749.1 SCO family protein [Azospirillum brasilense]MDW7557172.1 SCO family protein [Azospirillum brasilense]MDW7593128.1 SCO family protein [Azospirillum brasilense]MDW7626921.1 SCO family protein [Azospirillum brasilense]